LQDAKNNTKAPPAPLELVVKDSKLKVEEKKIMAD
jgi:hypothetical protein